MSPAPRRPRRGSALALGAALVWAAGCGGDLGTSIGPLTIPTPPHGAPTAVDVCALVTPRDAARVLGRPLRPVGMEYGAAQVATLDCDLGQGVLDARLSVELAVGPISSDVFEDAYGEPAGGDPVFVKRLGEGAFVRTETGQKSVHVLAHGSILTLRAAIDPTDPISRSALVRLAELALSKLPTNPVLVSTDGGRVCSRVPLPSVTAAVGAQPSLFSHFDSPDGSLSCSWASKPGAAVVTMVTSPARMAAYRRLAASRPYRSVGLEVGGARVWAASRTDRAGDLLIVTPRSAVLVTVMPTAGFSTPRIETTPGERTFAVAVVRALT